MRPSRTLPHLLGTLPNSSPPLGQTRPGSLLLGLGLELEVFDGHQSLERHFAGAEAGGVGDGMFVFLRAVVNVDERDESRANFHMSVVRGIVDD